MSKQSDNSKGSAKGVRPLVTFGIFAAALAVMAVVLVLKPKSPAPPSEASPDTAASPAPGRTSTAAPTTAVRTENAALSPGPAPVGAAPVAGAVAHAATDDQASVQDLIKKLNDASLPLSERKATIRGLARLGTPEALAALKQALTGGTDELRAAIAAGLGDCSSPECTTLLLGLLNDPNQTVIQAAIRGLAQLGSPAAVTALTQLLNDSLRSGDLRSEAALALGEIEQPAAMEALTQAAVTIGDEDIVAQVLDAIGGRDFSETQSFFRQYLGSAVSSELRVAAIESLWQAKGDPSAFLADYLADADAEVRASAAWALGATDTTGTLGSQLLASLQSEQDAEVRRRLFQALGNQESFDINTVIALVQRETDPAARVAGMDLLASSLRDNPTPEAQRFFDQTVAPALKTAALTGEGSQERMAAVIALIRASTPSAISALREVAQNATDRRIKEAATKAVANPLPVFPKPSR